MLRHRQCPAFEPVNCECVGKYLTRFVYASNGFNRGGVYSNRGAFRRRFGKVGGRRLVKQGRLLELIR